MRLVVHRVKETSVSIDGKVVSSIGQGPFILASMENAPVNDGPVTIIIDSRIKE